MKIGMLMVSAVGKAFPIQQLKKLSSCTGVEKVCNDYIYTIIIHAETFITKQCHSIHRKTMAKASTACPLLDRDKICTNITEKRMPFENRQ